MDHLAQSQSVQLKNLVITQNVLYWIITKRMLATWRLSFFTDDTFCRLRVIYSADAFCIWIRNPDSAQPARHAQAKMLSLNFRAGAVTASLNILTSFNVLAYSTIVSLERISRGMGLKLSWVAMTFSHDSNVPVAQGNTSSASLNLETHAILFLLVSFSA